MEVQTKNTDLYTLYQFYQESGDERRARQLKSLIQKQNQNRFVISFSGHFSAGKSSLINELMNDSFLPTSPVPTSANVVRLTYGQPQIDIFYRNGGHLSFTPPYDEKAIWDYCKNGMDVSEVLIQTDQGMPEHLEWMDTPGIDSTDPMHMANTEDAVILADHIFYVVDYNHVLAQENYQFLLTLQKMKKPFHLVISQVDKHRESEISFEKYKQSILASLSTWHLAPQSIHFISIKDKNLDINEWESFQFYLKDLSTQKTEAGDLTAIIEKLNKDHETWWNNQHADDENELKQQLPDEVNEFEIRTELSKLNDQAEKLAHTLDHGLEEIYNDGEKTVQSAILMPYEVRELARHYIESCQSNFKVGLFSSKAKVEKEQNRRLDALCQNLNQLLLTMNRQAAESLLSSLSTLVELGEDFKQRLFSLKVEATSDVIKSHVQKGALATGEYILNFTSALENALKKEMKNKIRLLLEDLEPSILDPIKKNITDLKTQISHYKELLKQIEAFNQFKDSKNDHLALLDEIMNGRRTIDEETIASIEAEWKQELENQTVSTFVTEMNSADENVVQVEPTTETDRTISDNEPINNDKDWESHFRHAAQILSPLDGFSHLIERLLKRADRLKNKRYTIALFGAFSAGKSSFANALMGHSVLPVSPHPTTATINRIFPVDQDHSHETVVITLKDEKAVLSEVNQALESFHEHINELGELKNVLERLQTQFSDSHHMVFLKAVVRGYPELSQLLGQVMNIPLQDALSYISEEQKACFVDTADIYYDCELTRNGIVLVDTPGADSINARHTDTAFRFIRNADALVYVTYYNHAFSRADEEFLIQLGRVKDTFELDKMFFVINAIDLANSSSEVDDVKNYVRERLLSFGIRQARLYGVSSLKELQASDSAETGFAAFYKDWHDFVQYGLQKQSIDQGMKDLTHAGRLLDDLFNKVSMSEKDKEIARREVQDGYGRALSIIQKTVNATYLQRLQNEVHELFFYVKKRVIQRYIDEFSSFFNPAVLSGEQSENKKALLRRCLDECIQFLSFDIDQEVRATYLRTEAMLRKLIKEARVQVNAELGTEWSVAFPDEFDWEAPVISASLKNVQRAAFESCFKFYKNPKQFFEGNGKQQLRDALQELLTEHIDEILAINVNTTLQHYNHIFNQTMILDRQEAGNELDIIFHQRMKALSEDVMQAAQLQEAKANLNQLFNN
ncbi:MAG: dynamin family protein [Tuberibacillus sp.]